MRPALALSSVSCLIFTTSIAVTRQEQNAEAAFKNIVSFKGKKASDVVPAMRFMTASLNVKCEFCHNPKDYASDEKDEKLTTRRMIAMQTDINERNFGGQNRVTCATCHAGHPRPMNMPPLPGIEDRPRRARDVTADQIVALFTKAVSSAASKPVPAMRWEGEQTGTEKLKTEADYAADGKFLLAVYNPKGDVKVGYDGTKVWYGRGKDVRAFPPFVAIEFVNQAKLFLTPDSLPKWSEPTAGTAKIGTRDMLVLSGAMPDSKIRASIFFDKQTGLPARSAYYYPTILGSTAQINDFSDYKNINGFEIPTTIGTHSSNEDSVKHFRSIKMNAKIDPTIFDQPK